MSRITGTSRSAVRRAGLAIVAVGLLLALPTVALAAPIRVVIDPGHGGKDPGASGAGVMEKNTNLAISRAVATEAAKQGWQVRLTRRNDTFLALKTRPAVATAFKADVFVSIHSNSNGTSPRGNMTIYRTASGRRLGQAIMNEISRLTPYKDIGNRADVRGLAVLRASKKPAVIVELLSMTSPTERMQLRDPEMQQRYAKAIVRGIAKNRGVAFNEAAAPGATPTASPAPEAAVRPPAPMSAPAAARPTETERHPVRISGERLTSWLK